MHACNYDKDDDGDKVMMMFMMKEIKNICLGS